MHISDLYLKRLRWARRYLTFAVAVLAASSAALLIAANFPPFATKRNIPYRALDPRGVVCSKDAEEGWDILASKIGNPERAIGNNEWAAIDVAGADTHERFTCSVQRHALPGYVAPDGTTRRLIYDLAFVELQEDGKPYVLREPCLHVRDGCRDEGSGQVRKVGDRKSQLKAIIDRLDPERPNYVMVFIHGWRHNADVGDSNVGDFRHYAAHAARFLEDRFTNDPTRKPLVTAIYVGWRGARTDENWAKRHLGVMGEWIASLPALPTLFDRKPVSEAIAPSALSALRAIEHRLKIDTPLASPDALPTPSPNRMIVFGHSLGGNMLASALEDDLVKKVSLHEPRKYMLPVVGDLVVLINPAAEASKWIAVQRAVWRRIPMGFGERASVRDYSNSHAFFHPEQRPIIISITAALDWPPGGRTETDCAPPPPAGEEPLEQSRNLVSVGVDYDWATYDMFPAFKGDFRPIADSIVRWSSGRNPHDRCLGGGNLTWQQRIFGPIGAGLAQFIRVVPFMRTDPEESHTIGHLDPARAVQGGLSNNFFPARPFGTTHELRGLSKQKLGTIRKWSDPNVTKIDREVSIDYNGIISSNASCPAANGWLTTARARQLLKHRSGHSISWDSKNSGENSPALQFVHGFQLAGIAAVTRARDPFWNMRAFDTALARHDGFMLSSFICAMSQLVMDDITSFAPVPAVLESTPNASSLGTGSNSDPP